MSCFIKNELNRWLNNTKNFKKMVPDFGKIIRNRLTKINIFITCLQLPVQPVALALLQDRSFLQVQWLIL